MTSDRFLATGKFVGALNHEVVGVHDVHGLFLHRRQAPWLRAFGEF